MPGVYALVICMNESPFRRIRSFVRRDSRLTEGQQRAMDELMPRFGIEYAEQALDLDAVFGRAAAHWLEIGCGNGDTLLAMASCHPERDFIGIEVHTPGVGRLLQGMEERHLSNIRMIRHDAIEVLEHMIPAASLDGVMLYFPDPWHKKRHKKRRIVQPAFVAEMARVLKPGGVFHLATDWEDYARQMLQVMESSAGFENMAGAGQFSPRPDDRPLTKFEQRGLRLGHGVWDLIYRRK